VAIKIIDVLIGGQEDVEELVKLRYGKMKATVEELVLKLKCTLDKKSFLCF